MYYKNLFFAEVALKNSLRTGTLILFASLLFLATACGTKSGEEGDKGKAAQSTKTQKLNVDMDTEKRYQDAADRGFQPWKKNAMDVAEECIINTGVGAKKGECRILSEDASNAEVLIGTKDGNFKVRLKRLVKPDGIWTATDIEKE